MKLKIEKKKLKSLTHEKVIDPAQTPNIAGARTANTACCQASIAHSCIGNRSSCRC
ncbi:hypothetical protein [Pseudoalteromonas luteoviolacea]|uniref:Uncharacterized protein n=1 Tax=Pseudoalteromonas luteoviolacea H33 TaxID=1365251 RepID=A0A167EDB5_9GAMM|nr:hypothetical protein [Pseudoalteromonas luteoviolacea]KZN50424.1 hypothetical protein N476_16385 [Pseudoalteromonas luteoviolacea H33]KZN77927.1 hypothetical protein N477_11080 [Pseudoalteromonas luteoviolacea H33-S]